MKKRNNKLAFTIAEMMVVLLIISIVMVASAPLITKRKALNDSIWRWTANNTDIYFGMGEKQSVMIGQNSKVNGEPDSKLILSANDNNKNSYILFKHGANSIAELIMSNDSILLGTPRVSDNAIGSSNTAIGIDAMPLIEDGRWNTAIGHLALSKNVSGNSNTALGECALQETTGPWNIGVGTNAGMYNTTGQNNVFVGTRAGEGKENSTTGKENVFVGKEAGLANTTGNRNVFIGSQAGQANTTGNNNIAIGAIKEETETHIEIDEDGNETTVTETKVYPPLGMNTTGSDNIAIGMGTLARSTRTSYNIAIGFNALNKNASNYNTAIGYKALQSNTSGNLNVAVGDLALSAGTSAYDNVAIGHKALEKSTTGAYNTAIGSAAMALSQTGSHNTAVGRIALHRLQKGSGNVAIGEGALSGGDSTTPITAYTPNDNTAIGISACKNAVGSNNICVGANSGPATPNNTNNYQIYLGTTSHTYNAASVSLSSSDKRLKNIKSEFKYGLEALRGLTSYNFTYKSDKTNKNRISIIAQDLQKVVPQLVSKDSEGYLTIQQEGITYMLMNAIKQLDTIVQALISEVKVDLKKVYKHDEEIKALQKQNKELIKQNQELEKRITRLEKLIDKK